MRIGRSRSFAAWMVASMVSLAPPLALLANSTIRIAFLAADRWMRDDPDLEEHVIREAAQQHRRDRADQAEWHDQHDRDRDRPAFVEGGEHQEDDQHRQARVRSNVSAPACVSCSDCPLHSTAKPGGSSADSRSISAIASPLEYTGRRRAGYAHAGKPLYRTSWSGLLPIWGYEFGCGHRRTGIVAHLSFRTSSRCMRALAGSACTITCCSGPCWGSR